MNLSVLNFFAKIENISSMVAFWALRSLSTSLEHIRIRFMHLSALKRKVKFDDILAIFKEAIVVLAMVMHAALEISFTI